MSYPRRRRKTTTARRRTRKQNRDPLIGVFVFAGKAAWWLTIAVVKGIARLLEVAVEAAREMPQQRRDDALWMATEQFAATIDGSFCLFWDEHLKRILGDDEQLLERWRLQWMPYQQIGATAEDLRNAWYAYAGKESENG